MTILPTLDERASAVIFGSLSPPPLCQLSIFEGQYLLTYQEDSTHYTKFISSAAVRAAFVNLPVDSGFLPPGVVRWGSGSQGDWLVQFIPATRYNIPVILNSEVIRLTVPLPPLIFMGIDSHYYVWAVKVKMFNPNALAFHAPLPNINECGLICFGSNHVPKVSSKTFSETWQIFFNSAFNGDLASGKSRSYPNDVRPFLVGLATLGKKRYPYRDLVSTGVAIATIIDTLVNKAGGF